MKPEKLKELLKDYDNVQVQQYIDYLNKLQDEVNKTTNKKSNPWMHYRSEELLSKYFIQVDAQGLIFDGKHITLQAKGVSFDYVAYKNKMLLTYPETIMDISIVYKGDTFDFRKKDGKVIYSHEIINPFGQIENNIVGGYCVIKNQRGEFLTLLSKADIDKHRKVANTDKIWSKWPKEMCLKTVSKKACKQHFEDVYTEIEELDNENYDLEQPLGITVDIKSKLEKITTIEKLKQYYLDNKDTAENTKDFNKAVNNRKKALNEIKETAEKIKDFNKTINKKKELESNNENI